MCVFFVLIALLWADVLLIGTSPGEQTISSPSPWGHCPGEMSMLGYWPTLMCLLWLPWANIHTVIVWGVRQAQHSTKLRRTLRPKRERVSESREVCVLFRGDFSKCSSSAYPSACLTDTVPHYAQWQNLHCRCYTHTDTQQCTHRFCFPLPTPPSPPSLFSV